MESLKGKSASEMFSVNVSNPKLNGYFILEYGKRASRVRVELDRGRTKEKTVVLVRNGSWVNISAPNKETVDEFMIPFSGTDKNINPNSSAPYRWPFLKPPK